MYPTTPLTPGQQGNEVKKLQDFLVSKGYLTQAQVNTGYGIYGPQTTQAVARFQKDSGIDNSSGPGYWGPKTISAISTQAPSNQGATSAFDESVYKNALKNDRELRNVDVDAISNAYATGDWSSLTSPTGTPFSKKQYEGAYSDAEKALRPGFEAKQAYETAGVEDVLAKEIGDYENFTKDEAKAFEQNKQALDQNAAESGILFSGARFQKENDLRNTFEDRQARTLSDLTRNIGGTARDYQYQYGNQNANKLSNFYKAPQGNVYNANVSQNMVKPSMNMGSLYNPNKYKFQGTTVNTQKAQTQQRASGILANRANKLLGQY